MPKKKVAKKAAKKAAPVVKKTPAKAAAKKKTAAVKKKSAKAKKSVKAAPKKKTALTVNPPIGACIWTKVPSDGMPGNWTVNITSVVFSPGTGASVYTDLNYPKAFPVKLATNTDPEVVGSEITLTVEPGTGGMVYESASPTEVAFEPDVMRIITRFLTDELSDDKTPA